ncbi:MAG: SusC/RagA family TonB-linked outer membrane protein [Gemmatimonadales bacterium]
MLPAWFRQARRLSFAVLAGTILAFPSAAQAQEAMTITGRVTDETGEALATVNVYIDGTDLATITDEQGNYSLVIPASRIDNQEHVLVAGLIGYRAGQQTISLLGEALTVNFSLELDPIGLDEIVAVGQGLTRERRRLGATVNSISDVDIELSRETEVVGAIAGKAPNIVVARSSGAPGAGTYIQIRGAKSVTGGTQPLFVVDGTPYNNNSTTIESSVAGTAVQNRMADINPDDVESIEILKGPAGAAIYGASGANGVVLITTKSGSQTNTVQANVRFAYNSDDVTAYNQLQSAYGQGFSGASSASSFTWGPLLSGETYDHGGELFQTGSGYDVNATLSGGNARTTYFFSGGYNRMNGVIRGNNKLDRFNVRAKATQAFLSNFSVSANIAYTNQAADLVQQGSNVSGILLGAFRTPPDFNNLPYIDPETGLHRSYRCNTGPLGGNRGPSCPFTPSASRGYDNPFWIANEILNDASVNRTFGNLRLDWDPWSWLNVSNIFGVDYSDDSRYTLFPKSSSDFPDGRLIRASLNQFNLDNSLFLTATGEFSADFSAQITAGQNIRQLEYQRFQTEGQNVIIGGQDLEKTVTRIPFEYQSTERTVGYFVDANFDLWDQLFVQGGVRYDGFSTFGTDKQWFWFPNGSLAWEFTRALGTEGTGAFSFGKVRVAYGQAGQSPPVYSNVSAFETITYTDGWISPLGLQSTYLGQEGVGTEDVSGNPFIDPEITTEWEAGVDLAFLDSRVSLGAVYFHQKTKDAIFDLPVAWSTGFDSGPLNAADFTNKGWEFSLGVVPFRGRTFTWEIDAYGGTLESITDNLSGTEELGLNGFTSGRSSLAENICGPSVDEPCPYGVLYGDDMLKFGRGLTEDVDCNPATPDASIDEAYPNATPGALYITCNGFPTFDTQQRALGDPNADWNGGVRNTFTIIENLRLSALVDWRSNRDMWNGTKGALSYFGTHASTEQFHGDGGLQVFEGFGPGAGQEVLVTEDWFTSGEGSGFTGGTHFFIEQASYVKLRDVSIRYALGSVKRFLGFDRAEFSFSGRNLVTWTNYEGMDPESNLAGQNNGRGLEYFNNPRIRSYVFQINLVR